MRACVCAEACALQLGGFRPGSWLLQHRSRGLHLGPIPNASKTIHLQTHLQNKHVRYRPQCNLLPYGPRTRAWSGAPSKEPAFGSANPGQRKARNQRVASAAPDSGLGRWISSCFLTRSDGGGDTCKQVASPGPARPAPSEAPHAPPGGSELKPRAPRRHFQTHGAKSVENENLFVRQNPKSFYKREFLAKARATACTGRWSDVLGEIRSDGT